MLEIQKKKFINTKANGDREICNILGFRKDSFSCKYLGIPIDKENRSNKYWDPIEIKFDQMMDNYIGKWLSNISCLAMIKDVCFPLLSY